jgi:ankyrin repeat protein
MPPPKLPLEILLMIARLLLTDDEGEPCFADFNSFLKVNRSLYDCLNRTLWEKAAESKSTTERLFTRFIRANNLSRLEFFLELGADVETIVRDFNSPLTNINYTPLLVAAAQLDNVPMARLFLEHGADVVQSNSFGRGSYYSAIHVAHSAEMVQLLLDHDADPEQEVSYNGYRALHYYIVRGNIGALRTVLQYGVEVDTVSSSTTPLHDAVPRNIDAVKLLLEYGADIKMRGYHSNTPLHSAVKGGKTDVVRLLLERWPEGASKTNRSGQTPLHLAAAKGKTDMARSLLESWPEGTREKDIHGNTPLHLAAAEGKTDMARSLLEIWPEGTREKDIHGNTPLYLAIKAGKTDVVRLLLEHWPAGAREKDEYGNTLLHLAAEDREDRADMVELLLEFWPDGVREKSEHGDTLLHVAAKTEVLRLLLERWPAGAREKDEFGETPLHLAALRGETDMIRLLVESWPEGKEALNGDVQTPLLLFEEEGDPGHNQRKEIIALLGGMC